MRYTDEDIEFAGQILTHREELEDEVVEKWMEDKDHVRLLDELAAVRKNLVVGDFGHLETEELARLEQSVADRKGRRMTLRWSVAASIILIVALYVGRGVDEWRTLNEERLMAQTERTLPGARAELVLATGEKVQLGQRSTSIEGVKETGILNDSLTGLNYVKAKVQGKNITTEEVFNTMRIPVGGFYRLTLADGTKVWLNSVTELRYPVTFTGEQRKVYLKGEAYFEVIHDEEHPFIVCTDKVDMRVYGTEFNVNAYQKGVVQTTLVNGKVGIRVNATGKEVILKPKQMAEFVDGQAIRVENVDPYAYIAWKDGEFVFERETIEVIMDRLSRWYDVRVFYSNESVKQKRFTGVIDRYDNVEQVLRMIEGPATLRFEVKGNVVMVKNAGE